MPAALESRIPQAALWSPDFSVYLGLVYGPRPVTDPVARVRRTVVRTHLSLRYMGWFDQALSPIPMIPT